MTMVRNVYVENKKMGNAIRRLRLVKGYSLKEMSKEMEISQSYLSEIEHGKKGVDLEFLVKYATIVHINRADIVRLGEYNDNEISYIFARALERELDL